MILLYHLSQDGRKWNSRPSLAAAFPQSGGGGPPMFESAVEQGDVHAEIALRSFCWERLGDVVDYVDLHSSIENDLRPQTPARTDRRTTGRPSRLGVTGTTAALGRGTMNG